METFALPGDPELQAAAGRAIMGHEREGDKTMGRFYSDTLERALGLLYFQADESRYPEGVALLEQAVNAGEPDAYYFLARCYGWGDGNVRTNSKKARELSKKGIELGSDLCVLGADRMDILKGDVKAAMQKDLRASFESVLNVARAGEPMAQYAIGLFYFWGDMLLNFQKPSKEEFAACERANGMEALMWFRRSAETGCLPAFRNAFNSVRNGTNGVEKNPAEALRWVETMAGKADMRLFYHSFILEYQKLKDDAGAARWAERGAREGDPDSTVDYGLMCRNGTSAVPKDREKALALFKQAAELGSCYGSDNAGRCYYYGWGCEQNYREAYAWFVRADREGHPHSKWFLAYCYCYGRGCEEDPKKGVEMIRALQREGKGYPKELLGYCLLYGKGVEADYAEAKRLLEEAANEGTARAWRYLGDLYDKGLGVPEDPAMAVSCYQKAVEKGDKSAAEELMRFKKTLFGKWKRK